MKALSIFGPAMSSIRKSEEKFSVLGRVVETPRILVKVDYDSVRKEIRKIKKFDHIDMWAYFWIEDETNGYICLFDSETYELVVGTFNNKGQTLDVFKHRVDDAGMSAREFLPEKRLLSLNFVMSVMGLLTLHRSGNKTSTFTASRNKASVYYAEGDTLVFKRIFDFKRLPSPEYKKPEPGASGIRKKEHDVIGHYRTYKSGVKVWVKPHKRGDPSLGTVTSVFT